jgi:hypothetical protein
MSEITSENLALTCAPKYVRICGSPPVFAPVVTQTLTPCHLGKHGGERNGPGERSCAHR